MNNDNGHAMWSSAPEDLSQADEDFAKFLELGDFDGLDLSAFAVDPALQDNNVSNAVTTSNVVLNTSAPIPFTSAINKQVHPNNMNQRPVPLSQEAIMAYTQAQLRQYQSGFYHNHGGYIPPTPSSLEMLAGNQNYSDHTPFMDGYGTSKEDQV